MNLGIRDGAGFGLVLPVKGKDGNFQEVQHLLFSYFNCLFSLFKTLFENCGIKIGCILGYCKILYILHIIFSFCLLEKAFCNPTRFAVYIYVKIRDFAI